MKAGIVILEAAVAVALAACVQACKGAARRVARSRLHGVESITVYYLPPAKSPRKKIAITLTAEEEVKRFIGKMRFNKVEPCACKHKYRIVFTRRDGTTVTAYSYAHGWSFSDEKRTRRAGQGLIEHIDWLFGIREGRYCHE